MTGILNIWAINSSNLSNSALRTRLISVIQKARTNDTHLFNNPALIKAQ